MYITSRNLLHKKLLIDKIKLGASKFLSWGLNLLVTTLRKFDLQIAFIYIYIYIRKKFNYKISCNLRLQPYSISFHFGEF